MTSQASTPKPAPTMRTHDDARTGEHKLPPAVGGDLAPIGPDRFQRDGGDRASGDGDAQADDNDRDVAASEDREQQAGGGERCVQQRDEMGRGSVHVGLHVLGRNGDCEVEGATGTDLPRRFVAALVA